MNVLHTSDWHIGAYLENRRFSRLAEQATFIDELSDICDEYAVDLIIVAGDVFDTRTPSADAETLFYDACQKLGGNGDRLLVVIAGNHDDPNRLTAARSLLARNGVIVVGLPFERAISFENNYYRVFDVDDGVFGVLCKKTNETAIIAALPYAGEKRLGEIIADDDTTDENALRRAYSDRIRQIYQDMARHFRDETINIAIGHLYVAGGESSFGAERDISRGGAFAVSPFALPDADYVALGHLHRAQTAKRDTAFYCGSPLALSVNEITSPRRVIVARLTKQTKEITKIPLKRVKPVESLRFDSVNAAVDYLSSDENATRDFYAYITINTTQPVYKDDYDRLNKARAGIVSVEITTEGGETTPREPYRQRSIQEEFEDFYVSARNMNPDSDMITLFNEAVALMEETDD